MSEAEKRQHARRIFPEDVYTYVEGSRLDAATTDISAGGAFFKADRPLERGALVAVVFKRQSETEDAIFLVGRVVRISEKPQKGVGLRWTKAVTEAAPSRLAWFLTSVLGVDEPEVTQQRERGRWEMLSVYQFPETESAAAGFDASLAAERLSDAAKFSMEEPSPVPGEAPDDGSLTTRIARSGLRARASLSATVTREGHSSPGLITHLGATSFYLRTDVVPTDERELLVIRFGIPAHDVEVGVTCQCRVTGRDDGAVSASPGLDLEIARLEEEEPGILRKYVRWLHFQALARD